MKSVCMLLQGHYEGDIRVRRKAEALVAAGYRVDVLALRSGTSAAVEYDLNGVHVYTLSLGKKRGTLARYAFEYGAFSLWATWKLASLMRKYRYDIVDVNTLPDFLVFAAWPAKRKGAIVILDMHEITPEFYISKYKIAPSSWIIALLSQIERWSIRFADHVLTINEPVQRLLEGRGLQPDKSTIIMNSADENLFAKTDLVSAGARREGSEGRFVMMYHGTLTNIYGLDIAIDAFHVSSPKMPQAELWIVGGGPEKRALEERAVRYGLGSKVRFVGTVRPEEVQSWLSQCDIGVLATRQDVFLDYSFSNKLSEYIIMGKGVIASRLRTISHYFSDDALAYFAPEDVGDLARRMVELYQDESLRLRLANSARLEFRPIRWEVMLERYLAVMRRLLDRTPSGSSADGQVTAGKA